VNAAAQQGHIEAIRALCELGADINTPSKAGVTPVCVAAAEGHEKVVKLLRKLGADLNEKSKYGTPLDQAWLGGHDAVAEKLTRYTQCACCQLQATATVKLFACSRCMKTYYSSAACQTQDWKQHKKTCAAAAADQS
jgi:ankyrin repeat protein